MQQTLQRRNVWPSLDLEQVSKTIMTRFMTLDPPMMGGITLHIIGSNLAYGVQNVSTRYGIDGNRAPHIGYELRFMRGTG